ncbi:MAG: hypothetical protein U5L74_10680, partial [Ideonella sp.]|nr:hypothetical protein [Ideonella sp.]
NHASFRLRIAGGWTLTIEPLLRYLAAHQDGVAAKLAHEQVANVLGLSDDDKQTLLPIAPAH